MTMRPLGKRYRKVMRLLLEGNSRFAIASKMKLAPRTVYNIVEKLVYLGYIRQVPGTKFPAIYEQLFSPKSILLRRIIRGMVAFYNLLFLLNTLLIYC